MKKLISEISSYPIIIDDDFYNGTKVKLNLSCKTCKQKDCKSFSNQVGKISHYVCSKNYDCFFTNCNGLRMGHIGLILNSNSNISKKNKQVQGIYILSVKDIESELNKLNSIANFVFENNKNLEANCNEKIHERTNANFALLHDVKSSIGLAYVISERILYKLNTPKIFKRKENLHNFVL